MAAGRLQNVAHRIGCHLPAAAAAPFVSSSAALGTTAARTSVFVTGYRISFYCGRSQEPWSPRSVSQGIGGSQESLMAVAATLQQLGHTVQVYNSCGAAAGEYSGVVYEDYRAFGRQLTADLVIVWRLPWLANSLPPNTPAYLWLKDMVEPGAVARAAHCYRKIIIQSRFHRQHYAALPEEKF